MYVYDRNDRFEIRFNALQCVRSILISFSNNNFSSSTFNNFTESFVVMHASASKANMGNVVTNNLIVSLGTTQNRS